MFMYIYIFIYVCTCTLRVLRVVYQAVTIFFKEADPSSCDWDKHPVIHTCVLAPDEEFKKVVEW